MAASSGFFLFSSSPALVEYGRRARKKQTKVNRCAILAFMEWLSDTLLPMAAILPHSDQFRLRIHFSAPDVFARHLALLNQPLRRILNRFAKRLQESGGGGAVDLAVVEGEAEGDNVAGDELVFDVDRLLDDSSDTENGALGRVDDRSEGV